MLNGAYLCLKVTHERCRILSFKRNGTKKKLQLSTPWSCNILQKFFAWWQSRNAVELLSERKNTTLRKSLKIRLTHIAIQTSAMLLQSNYFLHHCEANHTHWDIQTKLTRTSYVYKLLTNTPSSKPVKLRSVALAQKAATKISFRQWRWLSRSKKERPPWNKII